MKKLVVLMLCVVFCLSACTSASKSGAGAHDDSRISVANVQREIKVGMFSSDVISVLGSPNMVTTDNERREVWVYDKVATERAYSTSSGGLALMFGSAGNNSVGGVGGGVSSSGGTSSTSQRTLTIIIKFDSDSRVRDYSYRQSTF